MIEGKFRPSAVAPRLEEARTRAFRKELKTFGVQLGIGIAGLSLLALVFSYLSFDGDVGFSLFILLTGFMIFGGLSMGRYSSYQAAKRKIAFVSELIEAFAEDVSPFHKLSLRLDPSAYNEDSKQYWTGSSLHGNIKRRYEDAWCLMKFFLPDGTTVRVVRRADVKVKKGAVMRHKRRVYLKISPSPTVFGPGPFTGTEDLEQMVKLAVAEKFHDPPEFLTVRRRGTGDSISLKVTQLDAPILGREVFVLVEAIVLFLQMSRSSG